MIWFLFLIAFVWLVFATVYDFKKKEIPNWGNFALVVFALAYRAFYAVINKNSGFFYYGLLGFFAFIILGYLFYYSRVFGGGDAKLMMALGAILPFEGFGDWVFGVWFIVILFAVGAVYSLGYSFYVVSKKGVWNKFRGILSLRYLGSFVLGLILGIWFLSLWGSLFGFVFILIGLLPGLYRFAKIVDGILVEKVKPGNLQEGDWLVRDVRVSGKVIKKSVHGLNKKEIALLRKAGKRVEIKSGAPFAVAFLVGFMVFAFLFFLGLLSF